MGRRKSYDRDEVLVKAMKLFWTKGFEGTHLSELVEVTGVNRFGLYGEFGGKEGLFQQALDLYLRGTLDAYRETLDAKPHGIGNIQEYFRQMSYGDAYHGCLMINTLTEKDTITSDAFSAARDVYCEAHNLFLKNLRAAQASGELARDRDVDALANLLSTLDSGFSIHGIVSPSNSEKDAIAAQALRLLE